MCYKKIVFISIYGITINGLVERIGGKWRQQVFHVLFGHFQVEFFYLGIYAVSTMYWVLFFDNVQWEDTNRHLH